jgi:DNA-nicking Smr family endonuclease
MIRALARAVHGRDGPCTSQHTPRRAVTAYPATGTGTQGASRACGRNRTGMKLKLDLHDIYNKGGDIDRALRAIIDEAVAKKAPLVEIIPGKGSGALKKHVLRFLDQKEIKVLYHRVEKDSTNFGRVFVHFRWK